MAAGEQLFQKNQGRLMFEGFSSRDIEGPAGNLHALQGGSGAPLLLLHGHPQTHVMWHAVAGELAKVFTVVMMDLRGYGDSVRAASDADAPSLFQTRHGAGRHGCHEGLRVRALSGAGP
jgi:pimeloyl-ACP methyl ester carboxylesterase